MRDLIVEPDSPVRGFMQGAVRAAAAVGLPVTLTLLFRAGFKSLGDAMIVTLVAALIGGVALAIWRLIQRSAYRRLFDGLGF